MPYGVLHGSNSIALCVQSFARLPALKLKKKKIQISRIMGHSPLHPIRPLYEYIGETKRGLSEHKGYISSIFPNKATGIHLNKPGDGLKDVIITIL